ncbi:MAG: sulfatase-like hydrolase/transferase [Phycisphaerales bacterium]
MKQITRRDFLSLAGTMASIAALNPKSLPFSLKNKPVNSRKPNILLIVADDLGYADLGCQGQKDISTPNIDSLAENGIRFTDAYVSCPVCGPSRAGFLTGRYQNRFGYEYNIEPNSANGLPLSEKTIGDYFKALGYKTALIGKWHQGEPDKYRPNKRGFDEFFGFLGGSHYYFPDDGRGVEQKNINWRMPLYRNNQIIEEKEYLTDAFARESLNFINKNSSDPFFLYLSFNAVHSPLEVVNKYKNLFEDKIADKKRLTYAAMLSAMDEAVGKILTAIRTNNLENDTLIFFISDNGGPTQETTSSNLPLSGGKSQLLEGGIRVPMIMQWKGKLPSKIIYRKPVTSLDIIPTALAAAECKQKNAILDGINLFPYFSEKNEVNPHETLYWRYGNAWAIRKGNYKLLSRGEQLKLFNLSNDIAEKNDLSQTEKEKFNELKSDYDKWNSQNKKPIWDRPNYNRLPKNFRSNAD